LEGEKRFDVAWGMRVDERCLVQTGMFDFASEPEREEAGTTTVASRGRTVCFANSWGSGVALTLLQCLMLVLDMEKK
jgi:hypothetical protein